MNIFDFTLDLKDREQYEKTYSIPGRDSISNVFAFSLKVKIVISSFACINYRLVSILGFALK